MIFQFDEYELDAERLQLRRSGSLLKVDAPALRLLGVLLQRAGELVSKQELLEQVWEARPLAENAITVAMARLRKALVPGRGGSEFISTVYGAGYRFVRPVKLRSEPESAGASSEARSSQEQPYVGRARVLGRLREALSEASAGRGRLCVLMGEPGIGKTRAVEVLERELAGGPVRVAWGYCREAGETPPLWPWAELLRQIVGSSEAALGAGGGGSAFSTSALFSAETGRAPGPDGVAGAAADAVRYLAFERILGTITAATKEVPWLLVLDDLHRADAASLELLSHVVDRVARTRILVLATLRPAEQGGAARSETPLPRILGHRNCERISLERLTQSEVASYVAACLEQEAASPDMRSELEDKLARAVHDKSEGNPFFMVELLRQQRVGHAGSLAALELPAAALDLMRQRVAQIDIATRGLLSQCAVIGRSFELGLLAELSRREPAAVRIDLDAALRAEVVVRAPHAQTAFAFGHELMRAVLYDALPPPERRALHQRIGALLLHRRATGDAVAASDVAYHMHAALPLGDLRTTVGVCRDAAEAAAAVFGSIDVARYAQQALEALQLMVRPSIRLRMSLLYVTAIYSRPYDSVGNLRCLSELLRLAREHADGEMLARGGALLDAHFALQPLAGSADVNQRALDLLPTERGGLRALALGGLAAAAPHCYDAERCTRWVEQASALACSVASRGAMYVTLLRQLHLVGGPVQAGQASRAQGTLEQLEQMAQRHPLELAPLPIDLAFYRASQALTLGAPQQAKAALERACARARQLHHGELLWHAERALALLALELGEGPHAWDTLCVLHEQAERSGLLGSAVFCAFDRAVLLPRVGQAEALSDGARAALHFEAEDLPMFWALKLRALACAGARDAARAALHAVAPARLAQLPVDSQYLGTLGQLSHAALLLGESEYCSALLPLLSPYASHYAVQLFGACEGAVTQLLGALAQAAGETRRALDYFEQAIADNQRAGLVVRAAEASLLLAHGLMQAGDPQRIPEAVALARSVRNNSSRMGMLQLGRKAGALLLAHAAD